MDPLSAISLAGNVVQFVTFVSSLISTSKEIHRSSKGCTSDVLALETVYSQLRDFGAELVISSQAVPNAPKQLATINSLSQSCKSDCDRLLAAIETLKSKFQTQRKWESFKAALKLAWKKHEIDSLEEKLHQTQGTLTLQICALTSNWHEIHEDRFIKLQLESRALGAEQSARFRLISEALDELRERIHPPATNPISSLLKADDVSHLQDRMTLLQISETKVSNQQRVLKHLTFESRPARYYTISDAHKSTFQWVFRNSKPASASSNLMRWLLKDDDIFWVSGKPGSGKSTFMKFLAESQEAENLLSKWSYPQAIIIACHYFWSAGTKMQRSQQGLLQTLLYEIFRQCPELIESCCEKQLPGNTENTLKPWPVLELRQIMRRVANSGDIRVKFCMFIDGLDEYEGDHLEFCTALKDLAKSAHIKLCISSRPWNVFTDAFGQDPHHKLHMHKLTHDDIRNYARDRLHTHPRWRDLLVDAPSADLLIEEVAQRATGVFLWVTLVTKLLRDGLTEYDSYHDLRKRLDTFPSDLEAFFKHILESVEPFHQEKMATSLRIAVAANGPLNITLYSFHDQEYEDPQYALKLPLKTPSSEQLRSKSELTNRRLIGRCRGLLEVNDYGEVNFLHRTVSDFLRLGEMSKFLIAKSTPSFNPHISLLKAYTAWSKSAMFHRVYKKSKEPIAYNDRFEEATLYAALAAEDGFQYELSSLPLLDELDDSIMYFFGQDKQTLFRQQVIRAQLITYLRYRLSKSAHYFNNFHTLPLCFFDSPDYRQDFLTPTPCSLPGRTEPWSKKTVEIVRCLLEHGQDPNKADLGATPWTIILEKTMSYPSMEQKLDFRSALETGLLQVFLQYGADRQALLPAGLNGSGFRAWMAYLLTSVDIPIDPMYESLYLRELDDILPSVITDFAPPQLQRIAVSKTKPVWCPFLIEFVYMFQSTRGTSNYRLLVEVMDRILPKIPTTEPLEEFWIFIKRALPGRFAETLEANHRARGIMTESIKMASKRRPDDTLMTEGSSKRRG